MKPSEFRELIDRAGLSQSEVARQLEISDRTVRRYSAARAPVPTLVVRAVMHLITERQTLSRATNPNCNGVDTMAKLDLERLRRTPAYSFGEAAHYLSMPTATLRAWCVGQKQGEKREFVRLIVLDGFMELPRLPLRAVRKQRSKRHRRFVRCSTSSQT